MAYYSTLILHSLQTNIELASFQNRNYRMHVMCDISMTTDWHLEILLGSPDDQPSIESSKDILCYTY